MASSPGNVINDGGFEGDGIFQGNACHFDLPEGIDREFLRN